MTPTRYLITTEAYGTVTYERFDDTPSAELLPDAVITKVRVANYDNYITGIEVLPLETLFYCTCTNFPTRRRCIMQPTTLNPSGAGLATRPLTLSCNRLNISPGLMEATPGIRSVI